MNWLKLIERRKSVRQFQPHVEESKLAQVGGICNNLSLLNQQPLKLKLTPGREIQPLIRGFLGSYGRVLAPWYIVAIAPLNKESLLNLGYAGEKTILEMTALGLGTCWIGGLFDKKHLNKKMELGVEEGVRALIAWGKPSIESWGKIIKGAGGLGRRMSPEKIASFDNDIGWPWRVVLEAVRWAPSAVNRQPWRLWFTRRAIHIYSVNHSLTKGYTPTDIGIALSHIDLACMQMDIKGSFVQIDHPVHKGWEYWTSYVLD